MEEYGTRLYGYSIKNNIKLSMFSRGSEYECELGIINSSYNISHGPVVIKIWELEDGRKYYHI